MYDSYSCSLLMPFRYTRIDGNPCHVARLRATRRAVCNIPRCTLSVAMPLLHAASCGAPFSGVRARSTYACALALCERAPKRGAAVHACVHVQRRQDPVAGRGVRGGRGGAGRDLDVMLVAEVMRLRIGAVDLGHPVRCDQQRTRWRAPTERARHMAHPPDALRRVEPIVPRVPLSATDRINAAAHCTTAKCTDCRGPCGTHAVAPTASPSVPQRYKSKALSTLLLPLQCQTACPERCACTALHSNACV